MQQVSNKINIAIAENHSIYLEGLSSILNCNEDMDVLISASNGKELLDQMKKTKVDVVLLDLDMPIMDGKTTLSNINRYHEYAKVIILSLHYSEAYIRKYLKNGASSYLAKDDDFSTITDAVQTVYKTGYYFHNKVSQKLLAELAYNENITPKILPGEPLSIRENEIVKLICEGRTNGEMSLSLNLSQRTVENHRMRISKKIGSNSVANTVVYAIKNGLFDLDL